MSIPGVGPVTASVLTVKMGDAKQYECSRDFAACVELVPRYYITGGKANLLGISRHGDKNVKRLLVLCVRAYMRAWRKRTRISRGAGSSPHNDANRFRQANSPSKIRIAEWGGP